MLNTYTPENARETLQYVSTSEIPTQFKTLLISLLTEALRNWEDERIRTRDVAAVGEAWRPEEIAEVQAFLLGKIANSWQNADELLMHLATQLKRSPQDVRLKATELGYAAGIDFRVARTLARPERMPTTQGGTR
jgi:hypothetical protein